MPGAEHAHELGGFFFIAPAAPADCTLSLHDALPTSPSATPSTTGPRRGSCGRAPMDRARSWPCARSEEHTSELQSHSDLVCRLLLEKKSTISLCGPSYPAQ